MDINVCIWAMKSVSNIDGGKLIDIEDVAALLPAVIPNDTPKETLEYLWRNFAGFFKDAQAVMKFPTGIDTFVHQSNMRYIL